MVGSCQRFVSHRSWHVYSLQIPSREAFRGPYGQPTLLFPLKLSGIPSDREFQMITSQRGGTQKFESAGVLFIWRCCVVISIVTMETLDNILTMPTGLCQRQGESHQPPERRCWSCHRDHEAAVHIPRRRSRSRADFHIHRWFVLPPRLLNLKPAAAARF